jgi:hypothetical protein
VAAPCSQWIACSPVRKRNVVGRSTRSLARMNAAVEAVARMAADYRLRDDVSMRTLLERSGYLGAPSTVTERALKEAFERDRDLIESWTAYSEDQRSSDAPYLLRPGPESSSWRVGRRFDAAPQLYADSASACAAFVMMHIGAEHAS